MLATLFTKHMIALFNLSTKCEPTMIKTNLWSVSKFWSLSDSISNCFTFLIEWPGFWVVFVIVLLVFARWRHLRTAYQNKIYIFWIQHMLLYQCTRFHVFWWMSCWNMVRVSETSWPRFLAHPVGYKYNQSGYVVLWEALDNWCTDKALLFQSEGVSQICVLNTQPLGYAFSNTFHQKFFYLFTPQYS